MIGVADRGTRKSVVSSQILALDSGKFQSALPIRHAKSQPNPALLVTEEFDPGIVRDVARSASGLWAYVLVRGVDETEVTA